VLTVAAIGSSLAGDAIRLGTDVQPLSQDVRLVLDPREPDYTGSTTIRLKVTRAVESFRFHARAIDLDRVTLDTAQGRIVLKTTSLDDDTVVATASRPIPTGEQSLLIDFTARFGTQATGLYRLETGGEAYAFTQFEAIDARAAFPCWDEPAFKIPWQLTIVVPEGQSAVTNTPLDQEATEEGWRTMIFRKSPPQSSYLVAIAAGPLELVPIPGMSVPGNVVTVKGQSRLAGEAVKATPPVLAWMERYFGRPYPFEKLDLLAVPEFWPGAMENFGAITFADGILLVDPDAASAGQRRTLTSVMAHEIAHMWFGDLVTMQWWDDLWLNEAFASWMGNKAADSLNPEFGEAMDTLREVQGAMTTDARLTSRVIRQEVKSLDNLLQSADILTYRKGGAVLSMFEGWMGEETFRKGVTNYIESNQWGNATAADLWSALSKASGRDINTAMGTFLDQAGIPLVEIRTAPGGKLTLSQRRFLNQGTAPPGPQLWRIPVSLKYPAPGGIETYNLLLTEPEQILSLPGGKTPAWIYPNAGESAYYRWTIPAPALAELSAVATERLSPAERIGLLGNLAALLDAGVLHGDSYLAALRRLGGDPDPDVVSAVNDGLDKIKETFITPELREEFAAFVRKTLKPALDRIGLQARADETEVVSMLRPTLIGRLGDEGRDEDIRRFAVEQAARYLNDPASIDPSLAGTVLALAAIDGNRDLHLLFRQRMEKAQVPADRARFRSALGHFRDPELEAETLRYALEGPLRPQEILRILSPLRDDERGRALVFRWLTANYDAVLARIPKEVAAFLPFFAAGCDEALVKQAEAFFAQEGHSYPGTHKEMAKVSEAARDCAALRAREGGAAAAWLRSDAMEAAEGGQ
jgi:alanyl aminopeptidase